MVVGETEQIAPTQTPHPSGVPQEKIDNIMSGISNTGVVKMNNHRKKLRQRFDIIKKLGQGTYGKVQLGINKETGQEVAIKTIKKCKIEAEADLIRIRREVQIMSSVQHPNIIHIYEVFENREKMVLVMEFAAGGELYDYLSEQKVLPENEARRIFRQVSTAVYYCHKHKICHRDLKLENILLDEKGNAKIADFGLSNVFDEQRLLATFCGSPLYASPEIVKGTPYQGPEVDCWSLGVLLYTLVYGAMPFDGSNFKRLVKQISQGDYYEPKKPSPASPLIREMLTVCPQRRATIEQICNHWWVNEGYKESCLDLAEELANQTPVRLDVLLSLSPPSVTAEQLVVPSHDEVKTTDRVARSHSVGSIRDIGNTEAERRILDMVAAGGEAALMPSPTRTITPAESPVQTKRKLENTVSVENATGTAKKKEKPTEGITTDPSKLSIVEMDVDQNEEEISEAVIEEPPTIETPNELEKIENICDKLIENSEQSTLVDDKRVARQRTVTKLDSVKEAEEIPHEISPTKVIKQFVNKHKTADLVAQISKISPEGNDVPSTKTPERKNSLPDENLSKPTERRRSRIFETAEKFQSMSNFNNDKPKKIVIPGVSVGNFKKEFERKASLTSSTPSITSAERRALEKKHEDSLAGQGSESRKSSIGETEPTSPVEDKKVEPQPPEQTPVESSESKNSLANFSLEEARRSMENSIALLNQAKNESSRDVDQLCAKTESFVMSDDSAEREKKLKNAREIIGNAIQPGGRLCMGVRKPPVPFGINGRSISGSVVPPMSDKQRTIRVNLNTEPPDVRNATVSITSPEQKIFEKEPLSNVAGRAIGTPIDNLRQPDTTKTSKAEITLKSATLPRRKTTKAEIQLDIKPKIMEQPVHYSTEISHQVPDLRSAPAWEGPSPYSPLSVHQRANSLEPQPREHIIPIQKPPSYTRSNSSSLRSGSLSRQSTNESDTETATNQSQSTITGTSQPIKKSPREFIIPIAVEGGGYVTPRAGSLEPSESSHTSSSAAFSRIGRPRRVGSFLTEAESEEESPFQKMRNTSINRDNDLDEPRFAMHRLRSTRPVKKISQETNDSQSSGEDDDEDGFEILTAENLFSTLLQRVRALTNRLNVNNDIPSGFPNSRLLSNIRQTHSPFWHHEPFGRSQFNFSYKSTTVEKKLTSRLNNTPGAPWRHSMTRDISSDLDSMFSRAGATLPRGAKSKIKVTQNLSDKRTPTSDESGIASNTDTLLSSGKEETLDLADLDLSRLRLTKKDLETLSSITPGLPKCFQDQLLAKLPPNQARKLSRTLSMQNNTQGNAVRSSYKRSFSGGRETGDMMPLNDGKILLNETVNKEKDKETSSKYSENSCDSSSDRTISNQKSSVLNHYDQPSVNDVKSRSSSACKSSDEYSRSLCSSYSSEVSDKYKYCSSYLDKKNEYSRPLSPYKYYDTVKARPTCSSPTKEVYGRPPSGCLSPPPATSDSSVRRRSSQRRISRFLRPDFFDAPKDEASYRKERERETQSVLREIRERSRERTRDRCNRSVDRILSQSGETDYSIPHRNDYESRLETDKTSTSRYVRNKSVERFCDFPDNANDIKEQQRRRRSLSRPRELTEDSPDYAEKCAIAQKILDELESISASINQIKSRKEGSVPKTETTTVDSTTVITKEKTIKKVKTKDKADIGTSSSIRPTKSGDNIAAKKVVKTYKKKASTKNLDGEITAATVTDPMKAVSIDSDKLKKESKLVRPKSYPTKEPEKPTKELTPPIDNGQDKEETLCASVKEPEPKEAAKTLRPKSYPNSKILPPKELKISSRSGGTISAVMEKFAEKLDKSERKAVTISKVKSMDDKPITPVKNEASLGDVSVTVTLPKPVTKKIVKVKKISKAESNTKSDEKSQDKKQQKQETSPDKVVNESNTRKLDITDQETSKSPTVQKDKSPEKKVGKGILYTISQKFEKLRENAKSKEKKLALANSKDNEANASMKDKEKEKEKDKTVQNSDTPTATVTVKKKKSKATSDASSAVDKTEEKAKSDRKSRIDVMIRTLRERSVPRAPVMTESGLIKRAVSVEDMSGTFNKCGVNKVLGIFKKFEKDESERKVLNTRSTSNIESHISGSSKDRPKSTGFVCKLRNTSAFSKSNKNDKHVEKAKTENHILENGSSNIMIASNQNPKVAENSIAQSQCSQCPECSEEKETSAVSKRNTLKETRAPSTEKEILKDKRKGLMLDFTKTNNEETQMRSAINGNILSNYTNLFGTSRHNNNNNFIAESDEVNQNHLYSPSNENMTNYSSDSRSPHEEYPSSSTFFSPTEEPELCFDDWSICSEDNYMITSPSPAISRHSRISQFSSPTNLENNTESVIDRIKRRSFYCRFNEKKPKRQSNIVGPAARDYYRETASKTRTRPTERISPPEGESNRTTSHEYFKPLKLNSNLGNELKPALSQSKLKFDDDVKPSYKSPTLEYTKSRTTNYNDILPPINSLTKRYDKDYYRTRNSTYDNSNNTTVSPTTTTTPSTYYSTYNPKRRSSFTLNGLIATPTSTTNNIVDGYATLGRRIRPYDNRSSSLLDGTTIASSGSSSLGTTLKRDPMRVGSEFGNIPKSNISLRTSSTSTSRSPSNI